MNTVRTEVELDPLIHEGNRLKIMSVLVECELADFGFILNATALTRGNLSSHMAKLVQAGYIEEKKNFVDRKPHTEYRLMPEGRDAYAQYRKQWRSITGD